MEINGIVNEEKQFIADIIPAMMQKAGTYICKQIPMVASKSVSDHWVH